MSKGMNPRRNHNPAPEQQDGVAAKETKAMNIGQLKKDARGIYMGRIATVTLDLTVGLRPVNSTNPKSPKFDVLGRNNAGGFVQLGAVWEKQAANGTGAFLQGEIDDPSFPAPVSIAMFTQADETLNVAWSRPKARTVNAFDDTATTAAEDGFTPRNEDFAGAERAFAAPAEPKARSNRKPRGDTASDHFADATGDLVGA